MRVLLVTGEYPPAEGGVADYTRCLARALSQAGLSVHVATTGAQRRPTVDEEPAAAGNGVRVHRALADWGWASLARLGRLARTVQADIVHVQYQAAAYGMRPAIHLAPWWLARRRRLVTAVTYHDLNVPYLFPKAGPVRQWAVRALARGADLTVVTTAADHGAVTAWPGRHRLALVPIGSNVPDAPPHAYDRADWRARHGLGPGTELVAYFGFLNASKGGLVLVEALAALVAAGRDVRLAMIGGQVGASDPTNTVYLARFHDALAARALDRHVVWTGHVASTEVSAWLHAADVVALPYADGASYRRGSLLAALAHGTAIVTTRPPLAGPAAAAPGAPEPLAEGVSARLVAPGDGSALAAALVEVLDDPGLRARLAAGARALAAGFDWSAIAARHVALYRALV